MNITHLHPHQPSSIAVAAAAAVVEVAAVAVVAAAVAVAAAAVAALEPAEPSAALASAALAPLYVSVVVWFVWPTVHVNVAAVVPVSGPHCQWADPARIGWDLGIIPKILDSSRTENRLI